MDTWHWAFESVGDLHWPSSHFDLSLSFSQSVCLSIDLCHCSSADGSWTSNERRRSDTSSTLRHGIDTSSQRATVLSSSDDHRTHHRWSKSSLRHSTSHPREWTLRDHRHHRRCLRSNGLLVPFPDIVSPQWTSLGLWIHLVWLDVGRVRLREIPSRSVDRCSTRVELRRRDAGEFPGSFRSSRRLSGKQELSTVDNDRFDRRRRRLETSIRISWFYLFPEHLQRERGEILSSSSIAEKTTNIQKQKGVPSVILAWPRSLNELAIPVGRVSPRRSIDVSEWVSTLHQRRSSCPRRCSRWTNEDSSRSAVDERRETTETLETTKTRIPSVMKIGRSSYILRVCPRESDWDSDRESVRIDDERSVQLRRRCSCCLSVDRWHRILPVLRTERESRCEYRTDGVDQRGRVSTKRPDEKLCWARLEVSWWISSVSEMHGHRCWWSPKVYWCVDDGSISSRCPTTKDFHRTTHSVSDRTQLLHRRCRHRQVWQIYERVDAWPGEWHSTRTISSIWSSSKVSRRPTNVLLPNRSPTFSFDDFCPTLERRVDEHLRGKEILPSFEV